jgi:hypothetical protein
MTTWRATGPVTLIDAETGLTVSEGRVVAGHYRAHHKRHDDWTSTVHLRADRTWEVSCPDPTGCLALEAP